MKYCIQFSDEVDWKSFKKLPKSERSNILRIIKDKIESEPEHFGKPLRYSHHGLRRLRIGDCRVLYQIKGMIVQIVAIGHRSTIYRKNG